METICKGCGCVSNGYILCDTCYYDDAYDVYGDYHEGNDDFILHTNFMDIDDDDLAN